MELSQPHMQEKGRYYLCIEPTESVEITFDPDGVNAVPGRHNRKRVLRIYSLTLPDGQLALRIYLNESLLHKDVPLNTYPASFVICRDFGARRAEFNLYEEAPRIDLILEKIDLQALLKPAPEEPSDG